MSRRDWSTSNYLESNSAPVTAVPLTIAAWCQTSIISPALAQTIVYVESSAATGSQHRFSITFNTTNFVSATTADATGASANSTLAITANTWLHACGVFASATDRRAFLSGGNKGTESTSKVPVGIDRVNIGISHQATITAPFAPAGTGDIAEVAIWNIALSDADVARVATGIDARAVMREFLVGYWKLDGGGLTEVNLVNRNADMSVTGALSLSAPPPKVFMPKLAPLIGLVGI